MGPTWPCPVECGEFRRAWPRTACRGFVRPPSRIALPGHLLKRRITEARLAAFLDVDAARFRDVDQPGKGCDARRTGAPAEPPQPGNCQALHQKNAATCGLTNGRGAPINSLTKSDACSLDEARSGSESTAIRAGVFASSSPVLIRVPRAWVTLQAFVGGS